MQKQIFDTFCILLLRSRQKIFSHELIMNNGGCIAGKMMQIKICKQEIHCTNATDITDETNTTVTDVATCTGRTDVTYTTVLVVAPGSLSTASTRRDSFLYV